MNFISKPRVPYRGPISGGLHDGKLIEVRGHVPYGADVFTINLLTGLDPSSDHALHLSVRFHERVVVRNTLQNNSWGSEERHGLFPFTTGKNFTLIILVTPSGYRIAVNSQHCWEYNHRIPLSRVSSIFIDGSVQLEKVEFLDKINPYQQPASVMPPSYPAGAGVYHIPHQQTGIHLPQQVCPSYGRNNMPGSVIPSVPSAMPTVIPSVPSMMPSMATGVFQPNSSSLSPVYNPPIPYAYPIYGGLKPGMMIYISGRPSASAHKFTINLQSGTGPYPPPDIAFHLDVRFYDRSVVRNSRTNNVWAAEEKAISFFPFQPAVNFDMIVKVEHDKYMVALNGQHFLEFRHRLSPPSRFDTLYIENDIIVSSIRFA